MASCSGCFAALAVRPGAPVAPPAAVVMSGSRGARRGCSFGAALELRVWLALRGWFGVTGLLPAWGVAVATATGAAARVSGAGLPPARGLALEAKMAVFNWARNWPSATGRRSTSRRGGSLPSAGSRVACATSDGSIRSRTMREVPVLNRP